MVNRIGVDMDGVILDNYAIWANYYNERKEEHNHSELCVVDPPTWAYYPDLCKECYKYVVNGLTSNVPLVKGAKRGLTDLAKLGELWLISHRDPSLTFTANMVLRKHGISDLFTKCVWSFDPKLETCLKNGVSILIDDSPSNIYALADSPVTPIIFDYGYNRHVPGLRAYTWRDVVDISSDILIDQRVRA